MPLLGVAIAALLSGCGGATKTVTVANTPQPAETGTSTAPLTSTSSTPKSTPTSTTPAPSEHGGTSGPTTTRTATEPAFTHEDTSGNSSSEGLSGAEAVLQAKGFTANTTSDYHPTQTLRVLVGTRTGSGQQAFFFVGGHYIGTDTKRSSAQVRVVSQSDTEVTLAYSLSGSGGSGSSHADVRFQLNNGKLTPLDPIPSASSRQ
jgi:hypothetical protein